MRTLLCLAFALLLALPLFAAQPPPLVSRVGLYGDILTELKGKPENTASLLRLLPPSSAGNAEERAAFDAIVKYSEGSVAIKSDSFARVYNYYFALWNRYLFYGTGEDAEAAFKTLDAAQKLAPEGSEDQVRCIFEHACNTLALRKSEAAKIVTGDPKDAAYNLFIAAKRAAMSKGSYAARAALAAADLAIDKANAPDAKKLLREALELDSRHAYVTNQAYDRLGLILIAEGNLDGAGGLLDSAVSVEPDAELMNLGYACRLARALIESQRAPRAIAYLERVVKIMTDHKAATGPEPLYTLALGYTKTGRTNLAILYWRKYLDTPDPDLERRKTGRETAVSLLTPAAKPPTP